MVFLILTCLILVNGCSKQEETLKPVISLIDATERKIAFTSYPDDIVIAGKQTPMLANFAYLFEGSAKIISAIENRSQSASEFLSIVDKDYDKKAILELGAGAEQISPLEPEAVILKSTMKEQIGDQLETVGIEPVYVSFETIDEIYRDLEILGRLFNDHKKSEEVISFYQDKKLSIDQLVAESETETDILVIQVKEIGEKFIYSVPPIIWLQTAMIQELKANAVWTDDIASGGWMEVNLEQIFQWQPEMIVIINYKGKAPEIINAIKTDELWGSFLSENKAEILPFVYDFQSWDQPDPRWILGYANLAHYLYRDTIGSDIIYEIVEEFYSQFYGITQNIIEDQILPTIKSQVE